MELDWDGGTDTEDEGSSALVISATRAIPSYEHNEQGGRTLTLDAIITFSGHFGGAVVSSLHTSAPASDPPGSVSSTGAPEGGYARIPST